MRVVELGDQRGYGIRHLLQLRLALIQRSLRMKQLVALMGFLAGATDRIRQALQPLLDYIIARATGQRLHRQLFGQRAGDEDERGLRNPLACQCEGRIAIESGQHMVGEDHVERTAVDGLDERVAGPQALGLEIEAGTLQLCGDQLRIKRAVLQHEDAQALVAARSITHCCAAPSHWADAVVAGW